MTTLRHLPLAVLGLLPLSAPALEWRQTTVTATTQPFQKSLVLQFAYRNPGSTPVTLGRIDTNCDCITVVPDKLVCAPGGTGSLAATFIVGERYGRYERTITVHSSDSAAPVVLRVEIEAPELARLTPRSLEWAVGEKPAAKAVDIAVIPGLALDFTENFAINALFAYRLETIEAGRRYRLVITPGSTAREANTAIRVVGHDAAGHQVLVSAYANVR